METSSSIVPTCIRALSILKIVDKATYRWTISDVKNLWKLHSRRNKTYCLSSPDFLISNPKTALQRLELQFNTDTTSLNDSISLILQWNPKITRASKKILIKISVKDKNLKLLSSIEAQYLDSNEFLELDFLPLKSCSWNLTDTLHITCELMIFADNFISHLIDKARPENSIPENTFKDVLKKKNDGEVTFIVGNQNLKAHKHVLINRCSVFARMFESNMIEAQQNKVEITDARPEIFEKMIDFLYTDAVEESLNKKDAKDLLNVADKYQLDHLKEICLIALFNATTEENNLLISQF